MDMKVATTVPDVSDGAADKAQVQSMVARHCRLETIPEPADAADALGLAITYLMTARTEQRLGLETAS